MVRLYSPTSIVRPAGRKKTDSPAASSVVSRTAAVVSEMRPSAWTASACSTKSSCSPYSMPKSTAPPVSVTPEREPAQLPCGSGLAAVQRRLPSLRRLHFAPLHERGGLP